jgi:hypothetical protein
LQFFLEDYEQLHKENPEDGAILDSLEKIKDIYAILHFRIGTLYIETEDPAAGHNSLMTALQHLEKKPKKLVCELLGAWNQLGILWSHR